MNTARVIGGSALAVLLTGALSWTSRVPVTFTEPDQALLRLSWRLTDAVLESCRPPSEEELAKLPVHMRDPRGCTGRGASFVLRVLVDGTEVALDTVRAPGARADRPLTVLRDLPLAPGSYDVDVAFTAILPEGARLSPGVPPEVVWSGPVRLRGRDVALVGLAPSGRALELRRPGTAP